MLYIYNSREDVNSWFYDITFGSMIFQSHKQNNNKKSVAVVEVLEIRAYKAVTNEDE